jgi:hypothetical protein
MIRARANRPLAAVELVSNDEGAAGHCAITTIDLGRFARSPVSVPRSHGDVRPAESLMVKAA